MSMEKVHDSIGGDARRLEKYAWNSAKGFCNLEVEY